MKNKAKLILQVFVETKNEIEASQILEIHSHSVYPGVKQNTLSE